MIPQLSKKTTQGRCHLKKPNKYELLTILNENWKKILLQEENKVRFVKKFYSFFAKK